MATHCSTRIERALTGREVSFVDHALPLLMSHFARKRKVVTFCREMGVGRNIADIVVMAGSIPETIRNTRPLTAAECVVVAELRRLQCPESVSERLGRFSPKLVESLKAARVLLERKGGKFFLCPAWRKKNKIIAIEAKMRDWRRALAQARAYGRYADECYVLLPSPYAEPALKQLHAFEDSGVGLLIAEPRTLINVTRAAGIVEHDWQREFVFSRLFRRR